MAKLIYIAEVPADSGVGKKFIHVADNLPDLDNWVDTEAPNDAMVYESTLYKKVLITKSQSETRELKDIDS